MLVVVLLVVVLVVVEEGRLILKLREWVSGCEMQQNN